MKSNQDISNNASPIPGIVFGSQTENETGNSLPESILPVASTSQELVREETDRSDQELQTQAISPVEIPVEIPVSENIIANPGPASQNNVAGEMNPGLNIQETKEPSTEGNGTGNDPHLYGNTPGMNDYGFRLKMDGWKWDRFPDKVDNSGEKGFAEFEFEIDQRGYVISSRVKKSSLSPSVTSFYKQQLDNLTFSPTGSNIKNFNGWIRIDVKIK